MRWVYAYDPETQQQSSQWKSPSSPCPNARQVHSNIKTMSIMYSDTDRIVHHEFVPQGQTVNQHFYRGVPQCLQEAVRLKHPGKWCADDWLLHHDNAPAHTALSWQQYLAKNSMDIVCHTPVLSRYGSQWFLFVSETKTETQREEIQ
jgi:hypothetical protein